jgi:hypothetical protein
VIGDGHRRHSILNGGLQEVIQANGTIEQAVLGMKMEMNELRRFHGGYGIHSHSIVLGGFVLIS